MKSRKLISIYAVSDDFHVDFEGLPETEGVRQWLDRFRENKYRALYHMGFETPGEVSDTSLEYLQSLAVLLTSKITKQTDLEYTREETMLSPEEEEVDQLLSSMPFFTGMEYVDREWLLRLFQKLLDVFCQEIKEYSGTVEHYMMQQNTNLHLAGRVYFHLVEDKEGEFPFAFMATYATNAGKRRAKHVPLKNALEEYGAEESKLLSLLSAITKAAAESDLISQLMESGELFLPIGMTKEEAYTFLTEIPIYENAGIMCRVPNWWKQKTDRFSVSVRIGDEPPSRVGMDALLSFRPEILMGGDAITEEELERLLSESEGLAFIKGKWVEINHEKLKKVLAAYQQAETMAEEGEWTLAEALRFELAGGRRQSGQKELAEIQISNGEWLRTLRDTMGNPQKLSREALPDSFRANLRTYQQQGYDWLSYMCRFGFGACLADDMGLGKTVQILALLEHLRLQQENRVLLVIPASLLANWQKEIEKFAPKLRYGILHGDTKKIQKEDLEEHFLYITTYGMAARMEILREIQWSLIILDEAQAIKNPGTKQTKAIKQLKSLNRIAMTGTPIENRMSDLWSLFDFLNTGLLGTTKEFDAFVKGLQKDGGGYARLRRMVNPFILRRLKTDKKVISDLPDKVEMKEFVSLSKKQTLLYQNMIMELEKTMGEADGIQRKGMVLAAIMKFKQICNHPDQFNGSGDFKESASGKFERLKEICETIYEKKERVLVFTQFKEMTEPLSDFLETVFHRRGLVLHGGTPVAKRGKLVEAFNGTSYVPYMVLSLKAGGVGLNLTAANHVIHFDRWWNPAIENQATDRAFRIGQQKNVMVYKFVVRGTLEEKIDAMIEEKKSLASDIIAPTGENWIVNMGNRELMELFALEG